MAKLVHARIRFRKTDEGGRRTSPVTGVRSELRLGAILTSCIIRTLNDGENEVMELGKEYEVTIEILFWEQHPHPLSVGSEIEFYEGSRVVASGQLLEPLA